MLLLGVFIGAYAAIAFVIGLAAAISPDWPFRTPDWQRWTGGLSVGLFWGVLAIALFVAICWSLLKEAWTPVSEEAFTPNESRLRAGLPPIHPPTTPGAFTPKE